MDIDYYLTQVDDIQVNTSQCQWIWNFAMLLYLACVLTAHDLGCPQVPSSASKQISCEVEFMDENLNSKRVQIKCNGIQLKLCHLYVHFHIRLDCACGGFQMQRFHTERPANHDDWKQQLAVTNPQSFAVTFLNYVRAEVQPLIAAADSTADVVVKSSLSSSDCKETRLPEEKKSEATRVPEPLKLAAVDSWSDRNGVIGTSSVDSFAVVPGKQKERRKSTGSSLPSRASKFLELPVYEEDFPALGKLPTVTAPRKPTQSKQVW